MVEGLFCITRHAGQTTQSHIRIKVLPLSGSDQTSPTGSVSAQSRIRLVTHSAYFNKPLCLLAGPLTDCNGQLLPDSDKLSTHEKCNAHSRTSSWTRELTAQKPHYNWWMSKPANHLLWSFAVVKVPPGRAVYGQTEDLRADNNR